MASREGCLGDGTAATKDRSASTAAVAISQPRGAESQPHRFPVAAHGDWHSLSIAGGSRTRPFHQPSNGRTGPDHAVPSDFRIPLGRDQHPGRAVAFYPGVTAASITSSSAVMILPLVSGPRKTATIYTTSEPIVAYIIGLAKPMPWFTAK
jgi:hypothetical protein